MTGTECEKKFLIESGGLPGGAEYADITQYYLPPEEGFDTIRIRKSLTEKGAKYTLTAKRLISGFTRKEREEEISAAEFEKLKGKAVSGISKRRYFIPYEGRLLEIDVYPFWTDRCILEIELENEEGKYSLPGWVKVIRDVSEEEEYTNASLAARYPLL